MECECKGWACDGLIPLLSHHFKCEHYKPVSELMEIITSLIRGIEAWGGEEDGIPDFCFDAYKRAKVAIGQFDFMKDETAGEK